MSLTMLPAIDLRGGQAVRLYQGDFDREQVYSQDPAAIAGRFADEGAEWLHLVDLDAAKAGSSDHGPVIAEIARSGRLKVELGGGLRSDADVERVLDWGVSRVVVGTAAVENPDWVAGLVERHPGKVAIGVDARNGRVATRGWREEGGVGVDELIARYNELQPAAIIFTEIARDGAMQGPDLAALRGVLERSTVPVIASGGVHRLDDLDALAGLQGAGPLAGVIVGRALYEEAFTVRQALARLEAA